MDALCCDSLAVMVGRPLHEPVTRKSRLLHIPCFGKFPVPRTTSADGHQTHHHYRVLRVVAGVSKLTSCHFSSVPRVFSIVFIDSLKFGDFLRATPLSPPPVLSRGLPSRLFCLPACSYPVRDIAPRIRKLADGPHHPINKGKEHGRTQTHS